MVETNLLTQMNPLPDIGMLFKGEMVRAILDGKKTQTRRLVKFNKQPDGTPIPEQAWVDKSYLKHGNVHCLKVPYTNDTTQRHFPNGSAGQKIWVRETHLIRANGKAVIYRADLDPIEAAGIGAMYGGWKPSLFMARKHSRITLEITQIHAQRLHEITHEDALAEGVRDRLGYAQLWEKINGSGSWAKNPWVWAFTFKPMNACPENHR